MNATPANSAASSRSRVPKKVMTPVTAASAAERPSSSAGRVRSRRVGSVMTDGLCPRRSRLERASRSRAFGDAAAIASSTPVTMPQPPSTPTTMIGEVSMPSTPLSPVNRSAMSGGMTSDDRTQEQR